MLRCVFIHYAYWKPQLWFFHALLNLIRCTNETIQINILNIIYSYTRVFSRSIYRLYWDSTIMHNLGYICFYCNYYTRISILFIDQTYRFHKTSLSNFFTSDKIDRRFAVSFFITCHRHKSCYQYHLVF